MPGQFGVGQFGEDPVQAPAYLLGHLFRQTTVEALPVLGGAAPVQAVQFGVDGRAAAGDVVIDGAAVQFQAQYLALERVHGDVDAQPRLGLARPWAHGHDHLTAGDLAVGQHHPVHLSAGAFQPRDVPFVDGGPGGCSVGVGQFVAVRSGVTVVVEAAQYTGSDAGLQLEDLVRVHPAGLKTGSGVQPLGGLLEPIDLRLFQGHVDLGHGAVLVIDARRVFESLVESGVQLVALPGKVAQGSGYADARQRVQPAGGVSRGLVAQTLPLDDGGFHARLGQVVGHGAARRAPADDRNIRGFSHVHSARGIRLPWGLK